jgi:hypothetical protein
VADTRIHGTTRQQIGKVFDEVERAKLLPLPAGYPGKPENQKVQRTCDRPGQRTKARSSAPAHFISQRKIQLSS